ncbi:MAG: cation:proton antiporter [Proteobacteria bacterium]|nr:cation:proton antiporter [Pseudomonadota bacterium]
MGGVFPFLNPFEANTLITFGVLLLAGVLAGMLANRFAWIPTVTAFMAVGFILGPHGTGFLTPTMLSESKILIEIALGLILYELGTQLHPYELLKFHRLTWTAVLESLFSLICVSGPMIVFGYPMSISFLVGAIVVSSSPAVLIHTAEEMRADGPVIRKAKTLIAANNIFSFMMVTVVLPFTLAQGIMPTSKNLVLLPLYTMLMAIILGVGVAWAATRVASLLRAHDGRYRFAIVIGAVILTIGLATMTQSSSLFATLSLGVATRWLEKRHQRLSDIGVGEGGELFLIILFVMAGAEINPQALAVAGFIPLALVVMRCAGKYLGIFTVNTLSGRDTNETQALTLMLTPMAGMAIGITSMLSSLAPTIGSQISTLVVAMVAIFETLGPFAVSRAIRLTGEAGKAAAQS